MLIDSHCHIPHKKYGKSSEEVVNAAMSEGVTHLITIGTSLSDNKRVLNYASKIPNIYSSIGIYPHDDRKKSIKALRSKLYDQVTSNPKVKAIGECGIDISNMSGGRPLADQIELFEMQINLAIELGLPLVIHNRNGDKEVLELLTKYKDTSLKTVLHCFVGDWASAKSFLDLGHYLSFSGIITYKSGVSIHEVVKKVPVDRFMVETDAPYLSPEPVRNMTNEPKNVKITAQKVAAIRNLDFAQVCEITYTNTCNFFNLPLDVAALKQKENI